MRREETNIDPSHGTKTLQSLYCFGYSLMHRETPYNIYPQKMVPEGPEWASHAPLASTASD